MRSPKIRTAAAAVAVAVIRNGATMAVSSSFGLCCPDAVLQALGERFKATSTPRDLTSVHPIAAGDFFGTKGVDHLAQKGQLKRIIGGSYPSGPTNATPHRTAGAGGFVDITARAKKLVFSGLFNAGAKMALTDGQIVIERDGRVPKIVTQVDHISFSGKRAVAQGQDVTYVTERCVLRLGPNGLTVTEVAPGIDLRRDVLGQAATPLAVAPDLRVMQANLFTPAIFGLELRSADARF